MTHTFHLFVRQVAFRRRVTSANCDYASVVQFVLRHCRLRLPCLRRTPERTSPSPSPARPSTAAAAQTPQASDKRTSASETRGFHCCS